MAITLETNFLKPALWSWLKHQQTLAALLDLAENIFVWVRKY
tara:strand:- start:62 stop:187 length:126 start_codon:yes stop_codon:yes gene_type:complete